MSFSVVFFQEILISLVNLKRFPRFLSCSQFTMLSIAELHLQKLDITVADYG